MSTKVACFLILLISNFLTAQRGISTTIYLDSLGVKTEVGNHTYTRIIRDFNLKKTSFEIHDYYISGKLFASGQISDIDLQTKNGKFLYYHENGADKKSVSYDKNIEIGEVISWYDNGNKKLEGFYIENSVENRITDSTLKIYNYWNTDNVQTVVDGMGTYEDDSAIAYEKGNVRNGFRDGTWTGTDKLSKFTYTESYDLGKLISGISVDSFGVEHRYEFITVKPDFIGGIQQFYRYVARNFRTPDISGLAGRILITFSINADGSLVDAKVERGIHPLADQEALRIIKASGPWKPGELRGNKVKVKYSLPITIQAPE